MTTIASFLALSLRERMLLLEAAATTLGIRLALRFAKPGRLHRRLRRTKPRAMPVDRIAWAVDAVSRRMPGTTCLVSALSLQHLLSRRGHACELNIGVARTPGGWAAHAWVVCDGAIVLGADPEQPYTPLLAWRSDG